jgi:Alr-MurF fusion protein
MAEYRIEAIARACKGELHAGTGGAVIRHLITDSRKFSFPGESIFIAITGERHDGHNYIIDMYRQHIRNFLVSRLPQNIENFPAANFIVVNDTLLALQQIASMHRNGFTLPVIGITGSNGKTTVKEWLFQLLNKEVVIVRSPRSYNSQTGVPLSVWQLSAHHELAVFEAGISRPGEMDKLEPVIKPTIGLITNIGDAHQAGFDDLRHKLSEKLLLFRNTGVIVYCSDHDIIDDYFKNISKNEQIRLFNWSLSKDANLKITSLRRKANSTEILGEYNGTSGRLTVPFTDQASVENAIHAWAILLLLGYSHEYIAAGIQELSPLAMRMEQKKGINNCTIINDSYNSDPGSLGIAVDFLMQQTQHKAKTVVLSDIFETGRGRSELYKDIAELLNREKITRFIGIGTGVKEVEVWYKGRSEFFDTTADFLKSLDPGSFSDEAILLKGSRNFEFERISVLLEEKSHATVMEVNLNNLVDNYNYFKARLKPGTKIMAVVKAFSYGSGSFEIANILAYNLVDYLAVAFCDEGVSLRNAGIKVPIVVMNPDFSSYSLMVDHNLEPEIYNLAGLRHFIEKLQARQLKDYPVHIKLDTGMNRLGFSSGHTGELANMLKDSNSVKVKSVFSHLAASDDPAHDDFTRHQVDRFVQMADELCSQFDYPVLRHILNSAGIERFPEFQFDMVRLGIGMYGISSLKNNKLSNVNTFRSIISLIREVPAGDTIGYSRAFRTTVDSKIAIVPVGYADGLDRRLGNGAGKMIVNEVFAPVVGNICMDMCMLDITGIDAREGDEVIVFGDNHSISDIADSLSTIPYEVFTKISARVKRIYVQE